MKLTACYKFSAAHRLHSKLLDEDRNWEVYGRCNNPFGHGHNYTLELTLSGEPDPVTGLLVDRAKLDSFVQQEILSRVQHANLNEQVEEFRNLVPTTENVAYVFADWLKHGWPAHFSQTNLSLSRVRIYETRNNQFELQIHEE